MLEQVAYIPRAIPIESQWVFLEGTCKTVFHFTSKLSAHAAAEISTRKSIKGKHGILPERKSTLTLLKKNRTSLIMPKIF